MDLAKVKAEVKSWEKGFKAREGRNPTKEDIKKDPTGIADKYSLYRRLTKASQSTINKAPKSSLTAASTSSAHASSSAGPSKNATPRNVPSDEYPTTPTPRSRRSNSSNGAADQPSQRQRSNVLELGDELPPPSRLGKRSAPDPKSPSSARIFTTPKKPRPSYSGPVHDPNPVNPFSASPHRTLASSDKLSSSSSLQPGPSQSPFLHASSPRKLKELLESNSLKKIKERQESDEITPRTKARMRLTGDFVTPMKEKPIRRRRGQRIESTAQEGSSSLGGAMAKGKGKEIMREEEEFVEEEEDEFGPSPMRPGLNRTFTELLQAAEKPTRASPPRKGMDDKKKDTKADKGKRKQGDIMSFFGKTSRTRKGILPLPEEVPGPEPAHTHGEASSEGDEDLYQSTLDAGIATSGYKQETDGSDGGRMSTPPPDATLVDSPSQATPSRSTRAQKVISISDDEVDEWDPEGGAVRRQVVITGTRRAVKRRGSLSSESGSEAGVKPEVEEDAEDANSSEEEAIEGEELMPPLTVGGTATSPTQSSPRSSIHQSAPMPLLSLLSLRSPKATKTSKMNDLRVKAIFNPLDAARLKAARKGQDVYVSGEGMVEGEEDEMLDKFGFGIEADDEEVNDEDDDWEDDAEGWKTTQMGLDDEDW